MVICYSSKENEYSCTTGLINLRLSLLPSSNSTYSAATLCLPCVTQMTQSYLQKFSFHCRHLSLCFFIFTHIWDVYKPVSKSIPFHQYSFAYLLSRTYFLSSLLAETLVVLKFKFHCHLFQGALCDFFSWKWIIFLFWAYFYHCLCLLTLF